MRSEVFWGVLPALLEWLFLRGAGATAVLGAQHQSHGCFTAQSHSNPWDLPAVQSCLQPASAKALQPGRGTSLLSEGLSAALASRARSNTPQGFLSRFKKDWALLPHPCSAGEWKKSEDWSEALRARPQVWDVARAAVQFHPPLTWLAFLSKYPKCIQS